MSKKQLRIGLVGTGLMGRAHSNAYRTAPNFFDLPLEPVLQAVCARSDGAASAEGPFIRRGAGAHDHLVAGAESLPQRNSRAFVARCFSPAPASPRVSP